LGNCIEETALRFSVATVDDLIVGDCSLDPEGGKDTSEGVGDIPSCYVVPSYWRQGIGRLLCETTLAGEQALDLAEVTLIVLDGNPNAQPFFTALGFLADGTTMTSEDPDTCHPASEEIPEGNGVPRRLS